MDQFAKTIIIGGIVLIIIGVFWQYGSKYIPLGKLPGDIAIEKENFSMYFPITTMIILSIIFSIFYVIYKLIFH
ncbi:MAG: DUF2905 domain-containing protein [Candidatus Woesearchaeota archaeon]|jgi:hypothetical protein